MPVPTGPFSVPHPLADDWADMVSWTSSWPHAIKLNPFNVMLMRKGTYPIR